MATPAQRTNTWILDEWYDQAVAGTQGDYSGSTKLFGVGRNDDGTLGDNTITQRSSPVQIPGTTWDINHYGATQTTWSKKTDGTLWAWGVNTYGQVAQNDTTFRSSPAQIPGTTWDFIFGISGGGVKSTKTDGTMWFMGASYWGESGVNIANPGAWARSSPIQLPGSWATGDNKHGGHGNSMNGIKSDGTLWSWGYNNGSLGHNNTTPRSSPVQLPGTTWDIVMQGTNTVAMGAIKTDGTLWTWGTNNYGQLGHNNKTNYSSPKQVPGTTWDRGAFGTLNAFVFKTDGTLWAWGYNGYGALGLNGPNNAHYSSPVQIPGTTWSKIGACGSSADSFGVKTDGTLWSWGQNENGALGQNQHDSHRSSPTQVGSSTNWIQVVPNYNGFFATEIQ